MDIIDQICTAILAFMGLLLFYKSVYQVIGLFVRSRTYPLTDARANFAFVIAARNEESVIPKLIESIRHQDCNGGDFPIFVVADNCTDQTAAVCRALGAIVYERFDRTRARKGYALEFLFEQIKQDYGIDFVDAYFVFDADNLLAPNFVTEMNKSFAAGNDLVTSYRNTKNFDTNLVSAAYGIHFYRNSMTMHRARSFLKLGTHLTGTGYLIHSKLLAEGWHFGSFTEDDQITMRMSGRGYKVAYCEAAEFYDEQPTDFKTVYKQRIRWAKGRLLNFFNESGAAFKGIFTHASFTCYDMFFHYLPFGLLSLVIGGLYPLLSLIYGVLQPGAYDYSHMLLNIAMYFGSQYLFSLLSAILTVIREYKHIRCSTPKLIFYVFMFPWFDLISVPVTLIALFKKVEWAPIPHIDARSIHDLVQTR